MIPSSMNMASVESNVKWWCRGEGEGVKISPLIKIHEPVCTLALV